MLTFDRSTTVDHRPLVVTLEGDIDVASAAAVRRALRDAFDRGERDVVVDLADVVFIDAAGLGVLVGAKKLFANGGGHLRVANPRRNVGRVLEVTGLAHVLGA